MSPRTDSDALPPCPFCGGEASANGVITHGKNHNAWWSDGTRIATSYFVNCPKCGADNKGLFGHQSRNEAIAAWNTRADSPELAALRKERDALKEAGNNLSFAAQTSGGVAGRDEGLVEAIAAWTSATEGQS